MTEILRPTAVMHILTAQREAEATTRGRFEEEIKGTIRGVGTDETDVRDALFGVLGRVRALPSAYGDPE